MKMISTTTKCALKLRQYVSRRLLKCPCDWQLYLLWVQWAEPFEVDQCMYTFSHWLPGSSFVNVMACHLFGTKPLSDPIITYSRLDPLKTISSETWTKTMIFSVKKIHLKMPSAKQGPFCLIPNVVNPLDTGHLGGWRILNSVGCWGGGY